MCKNCYTSYIPNNVGFCPCCRQHLLFQGLKQSDVTDREYNDFIKDCMLYEISVNPNVSCVPRDMLDKAWMCYKEE
jgi:hypothetical protein